MSTYPFTLTTTNGHYPTAILVQTDVILFPGSIALYDNLGLLCCPCAISSQGVTQQYGNEGLPY